MIERLASGAGADPVNGSSRASTSAWTASSFVARNLRKVFPDHWSFMLGEIALYSFVLLVLTGTFLTFFFVASPQPRPPTTGRTRRCSGRTVSAAYDSVHAALVRGSGRARDASDPPLGGPRVHGRRSSPTCSASSSPARSESRVSSRGSSASRCSSSAIGAGFTGYSLPDDLLSGTGLRIIYSAVLSIPFVGTWLAYLFFGGEFPAPELLSRLFVLHILLIPAADRGAPRRAPGARLAPDAHAVPGARSRPRTPSTGTPVWPRFALKSIGLSFLTFAVLAGSGGPGADQPRLALRAVRAVHRVLARTARLLRRMARGLAAAVAELGAPPSSVTRSASCSCRPSSSRA